jgi:hypothetical protein
MQVTSGLQVRLRSARECTDMTTTTRTPRRTKPAEPRRESLLADFALTPISPEERRRAALAVCHRSATAEEARELLEALGLFDPAMLRGAA